MENEKNHPRFDGDQVTIPVSEYEELKSRNGKLKNENQELKEKLDWLMEQVRLSKKKEFGSSSEKGEYLQLDLFNEAEVFHDTGAKEPELTQIKAHKRAKSKELPSRLPNDLSVETIQHTLAEDECFCPQCAQQLHIMGKEVVRRELKLVPAKAIIVEHVQSTYSCRNCEKQDTKVPVIKAEVPKATIKGSFASPEAISHIACQKFVMGSPLYRQEQELKLKGIQLSRQTMSNWLMKAAQSHLFPLYERMQEDLKKNRLLHADETTLQVLREPGKKAQSKSFMWLYRTGTQCDYPIVLYEYQPDRKHKRPREFLSGFKGYLQVDGYGAYRSLPAEIEVVGCFAHARRKFTDALAAMKDHRQMDNGKKKTIAMEGKDYCDALFEIEREIKGLSFQEKQKKREDLAKPILDEMLDWLECTFVKSKSKTGEALTYLKNQWPYLIRYIEDGRLEISNNRAERSIKPFVIGRKNFLFANTPAGAKTSAVLYSIIETAKENGLDPYLYLAHIFRKSPNMKSGRDMQELLPYSPVIQLNCKPQWPPA